MDKKMYNDFLTFLGNASYLQLRETRKKAIVELNSKRGDDFKVAEFLLGQLEDELLSRVLCINCR